MGEALRTFKHRGWRAIWCSLSRWALGGRLMLGAALSVAACAWVGPPVADAAGPAETITVTLSPSTIVADGISTSTATATVRFAGELLPGQAVIFSSSDAGIHFSPTTDHLNGTYTATLTSSTKVGMPTITATSASAGNVALGQAALTQIHGPAKTMTLSLEPRSIVANGTSYTTAVATVSDANGNLVPDGSVVFSSSDPRDEVSGVANNGNGTYSALIRSSTRPGAVAIRATDLTANLSVLAVLRETASGGSLLLLVTMQWTFRYTPVYTKVLSLVVNGVPAGASVFVDCHARGCPFTEHRKAVAGTKRCGPNGKRRCATRATIDLTSDFQHHRLRAGTEITVAITRPRWIGKYYLFNTRAGRAPRVQVACLPPGATRPNAGC
ncbi:MAG: Ig-like domain-containing protein [Solirubrobacterales bacterium]|nr:Ig-like domain-containing protein [Solirubrobacterales bacterium]